MSTLLIGHGPRSSPAFGVGGLAPYEQALRETGRPTPLRLMESVARPVSGGELVDIAAFRGDADTVDHRLVSMTTGSILDLGCGPGRMLEAAVQQGRRALGVDLSSAAVELAARRGASVLQASVFDPLPDEGEWGAVLLLDGNVGIGGDPEALLRRAAALVQPARSARIIVEAHRLEQDRRFDAVLLDDEGRRSSAFPWAQLGPRALAAAGTRSSLRIVRRWRSGGRRFVAFAPC